MTDVEIKYTKHGDLDSYFASKEGMLHGPRLTFHSAKRIHRWSVQYYGRDIGSYTLYSDTAYWLGTGYASPLNDSRSVYRDAIVTILGFADDHLVRYESRQKFEQQSDSENAPTIIDIEAEETWIKQFGAKDHFSVTAPRYFGRIYSNGLREGPTVTFWESGLVRTMAFWQGKHIIGTRSCFDKSGYLWCEQNFAWDGSYTGNWTNRFFGWDGTKVYLKHVDVYRFWKLFKTVDGNSVKSLFDEVGLDRYTDPLVDHLIEYRRKSDKDPWEKVGPVDTSRFLI